MKQFGTLVILAFLSSTTALGMNGYEPTKSIVGNATMEALHFLGADADDNEGRSEVDESDSEDYYYGEQDGQNNYCDDEAYFENDYYGDDYFEDDYYTDEADFENDYHGDEGIERVDYYCQSDDVKESDSDDDSQEESGFDDDELDYTCQNVDCQDDEDNGEDIRKDDQRQKRTRDLKLDRPYRTIFLELAAGEPIHKLTKKQKRHMYKAARQLEFCSKTSRYNAMREASLRKSSRRQDQLIKALSKGQKSAPKGEDGEFGQESRPLPQTHLATQKYCSQQPDAPEIIMDKRLQDAHRHYLPKVKKN